MKHYLIFAILFSVCFSCKTKKQATQKNNATTETFYIENKETGKQMKMTIAENASPEGDWILKNIDGTSNEEVSRISMTIGFDEKDKKVSGNDGCNNYFGQLASFDKKNITFGALGATKRACIVPARYAQPFYNAMGNVKTYYATSEYLVFKDADGKQLLQFLKKED